MSYDTAAINELWETDAIAELKLSDSKFDVIESAVKNMESSQMENLSFDVWYFNGYESAIMSMRDHFGSIANANESMWEEWKKYSATDIENMLINLLKN